MNMMEFWEWMTKKYIEWRADSRRTISEFAKYVGVSQPVMSDWMKRDGKKPGAKNVSLIASKLGIEVYDILALPRPQTAVDPQTQELIKLMEKLPPDQREKVASFIRALYEKEQGSGEINAASGMAPIKK